MAAVLDRLLRYDERLVSLAARRVRSRAAVRLLQASSRAGDLGLSVATGIVVAGTAGGRVLLRYTAATLLAILVQKALKTGASRVRPCLAAGGPEQRTTIPDAGSFPSGHTLHAVMATIVVVSLLPPLAVVYLPGAALIAISRVALGVHYPSDVVAGGVIGAAFGTLVLLV